MIGLAIFFVFIGRLYGFPNSGDNAGENDACAKFCDDEYSKELTSLKSCKEGCKVFTVGQLSGKANDEAVLHSDCRNSCSQVYQDIPLAACIAACGVQKLKTGSIIVNMDETSPFKDKLSNVAEAMMPKMDNMFSRLIGMMKNSMSDAWQNAFQMPKSFDSWFNKPDDGIFAPDNNSPRVAMDNTESSEAADREQVEPPNNVPTDSSKSSNIFGNSDETGQPILIIHMRPFSSDSDFSPNFSLKARKAEHATVAKDVKPLDPSPPLGYIAVDEDWLACVGNRIRHLSMLTRWMLLVALIMTVACIIWVCLAVLRGAPKRRLQFLATHVQKNGVDNVYYTTPPFAASDKAPMILTTSDYKSQPMLFSDPPSTLKMMPNSKDQSVIDGSESPPPAYHEKVSEPKL